MIEPETVIKECNEETITYRFRDGRVMSSEEFEEYRQNHYAIILCGFGTLKCYYMNIISSLTTDKFYSIKAGRYNGSTDLF